MNETHETKPLAPAPGSVKCAVQLCGCTAVCEMAVEGEWFPICHAHSVNRFLPRRKLSPNNEVRHGSEPLPAPAGSALLAAADADRASRGDDPAWSRGMSSVTAAAPYGPVCCVCNTERADTDEDEMCEACWQESIAHANQIRRNRIAAGWTVDSTGGVHPPNAKITDRRRQEPT